MEISQLRIFAVAKFRECEFSLLRNFALANFRSDEISLQWIRNFAKMTAKFRLTRRKFASALTKFRPIFARTKNEKHRISLAFLLHSTVLLMLLRARDISKTLRRMGMIVDTSVGPAIFIVVGFVLKYI